jgi:hypothetical protein
MLKRLSEIYHVPLAVFVFLALAGLAAFFVVLGLATYAGLLALWPHMPFAVALSLAIGLPLVCVAGVGVIGAIHDREVGGPKVATALKLLEALIVAVVAGYLVFMIVQALI